MEIWQADRVPISVLCDLWNRGFADYPVPMFLTEERFVRLLRQELVSLPDSFVAMQAGEPVAFLLTGLRFVGDSLQAYLAGTAVLPQVRRQGFARHLLQAFLQHLEYIGAQVVSLTVAQDNRAASALYADMGFAMWRYLVCYDSIRIDPLRRGLVHGLRIEEVAVADVAAMYQECYQQMPEWQNRPQGEKLRTARALLAQIDGQAVGYALFGPQNYLYQLGVQRQWREQGIGSALLQEVLCVAGTSRLTYLNHPAEEKVGQRFLSRRGWQPFLVQREMRRELQPNRIPRLLTTADGLSIEQCLTLAGWSGAAVPDQLWVLEGTDGRLAGMAGAERQGRLALLHTLWVTPELRGQGWGRCLVEHVERWLRSLGIEEVYLVTDTAEQFFSHQGYLARRREQLPAEVYGFSQLPTACPLQAVFMSKQLSI